MLIHNNFYIDIGSYNGLRSQTYILDTEYNWKGICIEANSSVYNELKTNRPKSICINSLIWHNDTYLDFEIEENKSYSGRIYNIPNNKKYFKNTKVLTKAKTLKTICNENNIQIPNTIGYLNIDTNGSETYLLKHILDSLTVSESCIRYHNFQHLKQIIDIIIQYKYLKIKTIDNQYIYLLSYNNNEKYLWFSEIGFLYNTNNLWYGYINNNKIENLSIISENFHCLLLSNKNQSFKICHNELYEIINNSCYKITDGYWI